MFSLRRLITYIANGGLATISQFTTLFVVVEYFHIDPFLGSIVAFIISLCVGFTLHRTVTFKVKNTEGVSRQFITVASMAVFNLGVNAGAMYVLLRLGVHYLLAQVFVTGVIVVWTYIGYHYIFKTI